MFHSNQVLDLTVELNDLADAVKFIMALAQATAFASLASTSVKWPLEPVGEPSIRYSAVTTATRVAGMSGEKAVELAPSMIPFWWTYCTAS